MSFERMLDKEKMPTAKDIADYLGKDAAEAWGDLTAFLAENYNFTPETVFGGKKYGWAWKYRKGGRTLTCLFPEHGAFTVLVVLGGKEMEKHADILADLSPATRIQLDNTKQYHDGKWLVRTAFSFA